MKSKSIDYGIFFVVFAMVVFGMIMISSVSVYPSFKVTSLMVAAGKLAEPNNHFYLVRNISHVFIGLFLFAFIVKTPYAVFEKYAKPIFFGSLASLVVVLSVGVVYNGARGWINVPFLPFSLQPVEFVKLGAILYFAYFLKRRRSEIATLEGGYLPYMALLGSIMFLLALQPDFGSILLIAPIAVVMFFVGGGNPKHILVTGLIFAIFAASIYGLGKAAEGSRNTLTYITERMDNFLADNQSAISNRTINFQTEQGLIAIGSGGFFGLGFGKSVQKFGYLPEVQGDFIFSVIAEELGFVGVALLVSCYCYVAYRGFRIARRVDDPFAKYVAVGIVSWILIQAFVNMGVNLNVVPLTGVTLPFVSYGGSSLMSLMIAIGILLNISRHARYESPSMSRRGRGFGNFRIG